MQSGSALTRDDIIYLLNYCDQDELFAHADAVRREVTGDVLQVRGIIELSNYCRCDCKYCGLRASNSSLSRYRIPDDIIIDTARRAYAAGFKTIVLQSGEDPHFSGSRVADIVSAIKETGAAITLSLGEWPREDYELWYRAGADRYLLKHETANPKLFAELRPGLTLENRMKCLRDLREIGFQVGSGAMVGVPGQTVEDLADDLLFCRELEVDMAGFGPFISHPDTPLAHTPAGSIELSKRVVATARIVLRETHLPATTSLAVLDAEARIDLYHCGANVIMPDVTPAPYRYSYTIYPGKGAGDDSIPQAMATAKAVADRLGWQIAADAGHSLKPRFSN